MFYLSVSVTPWFTFTVNVNLLYTWPSSFANYLPFQHFTRSFQVRNMPFPQNNIFYHSQLAFLVKFCKCLRLLLWWSVFLKFVLFFGLAPCDRPELSIPSAFEDMYAGLFGRVQSLVLFSLGNSCMGGINTTHMNMTNLHSIELVYFQTNNNKQKLNDFD